MSYRNLLNSLISIIKKPYFPLLITFVLLIIFPNIIFYACFIITMQSYVVYLALLNYPIVSIHTKNYFYLTGIETFAINYLGCLLYFIMVLALCMTISFKKDFTQIYYNIHILKNIGPYILNLIFLISIDFISLLFFRKISYKRPKQKREEHDDYD
ncbi:MAG: hypothetical protein GX362_03360 [Methanosarcinaceae archaeon]|nr:hypothetical protein [Methanosarcinaceae archaeon]